MCTLDGCGSTKQMPPIELSKADRRAFLAGAISLPLATVLAFPDLARAQASRLQDVEFPAAGGSAGGVIAMPATLLPAPAVVLIHEWWGLNDQIKAVAAEMAELGYIALAIDLFGGEVATTADGARALMGSIDRKNATSALAGAVAYLRDHDGSNGKVGTIGWCFGGEWSLNASTATAVDATVIYYGRVTAPASDLSSLTGPVLGHFGTQDGFINEDMVAGFERQMAKAGKADDLNVHWYSAGHAFANPSGARYDEEDAALAWTRTLAFYRENLMGRAAAPGAGSVSGG